MEFPNDNGRINFVGFDDGSSFEVLGEECNSTSVARDFSPFPSRSGSPFNPTETSKSGKPVVNPNPRQTFIPIYNEEDANTRYLLSNTQTNLKEVNLMLVSNSGYEYTDEPGTRGKMWFGG